ncbi:hypothetical protein [Alicyclobacillus macrosporangiidus]|uniref:hypothetical protein n=1 Tax=Alicyclobacillus macrosporangiidus TaxID=392015 RepID=UPI00049819EC|nr:hypothetical protein [Alicyclobacillus macrosporangiidus]
MLGRRRRLAAASALTAALLAESVATPAYADNLGVFYYDASGGYYAIGGGDNFTVNPPSTPPPGWQNFWGNVNIAFAQANGRNILQIDTQNASANNGYLAIYQGDVASWVNSLQGNLDFVQAQVQRQEFSIVDTDTWSLTHLVPFATVVNESGAIFTGDTFTPNGGTYTDPNGKNYPTYNHNFSISPSAPPTANSISATVNGNTVTLHFNTTVPLWNQLATHHFDQITILDANGQVVWQPNGTTNAGEPNVVTKTGSQYSDQSEDITPTDGIGNPISFQNGTYTVIASVFDGVDRQSNTVTTTFTVGNGGSGGGGQCPNPPSLSAGSVSGNSVPINISDPSGDTLQLAVNNGGTLSQYTVSGSQTVTLTGQPGQTYVVTETDLRQSACSNQSVTVTFPAAQCDAKWSIGTVSSTSATLYFSNPTADIYTLSVNNGGSLSVNQVGNTQGFPYGVTLYGQSGQTYTVTARDASTGCTVSVTVTLGSQGPITGNSVAAVVSDKYTQEMGAPGATTLIAPGPNVVIGAGTQVTFSIDMLQAPSPGIYYSNFQAPGQGNAMPPVDTGWSVVLQSSGGTDGASVNYTVTNIGNTTNGSVSVKTNTPQKVQYTAYLIDNNGMQQASETFQITWVGATLSANPTSLPVGQTSMLTGTVYSGGETATLVATQNVLAGGQPEIACTGKKDDYTCQPDGNYYVPLSDGVFRVQATSSVAQSVRFWVKITPNPNDSTQVEGATSNTVYVTWTQANQPTITMSATPPTTTYGNPITESFSVTGWQSGDYVLVRTLSWSPFNEAFMQMWNTVTITGNAPAYYTQPSATHTEAEQPSGPAFQGETLTVTYVAELYNSAGQMIAVSNQITPTWTPPQEGGSGGNAGKDSITLTANPTSLPVGQSSTLTATTGGLSNGDAWGIEIVDQGGDWTLGGSNQVSSNSNVTTFNTTAMSQTPLTDTYTAYLMDTVTGQVSTASNSVSVTWLNTSGGDTGGGGQCPAPYDSDAHWVNLGNGDEELVWTHHEPYPIYQTVEQCTTDENGQQNCTSVQEFVGCGDNTTQESHTYTHSVTNGQISGLSYDPGTPNNMWMPVPSWQWDPAQCPGLFCDLYQRHGWTGWEIGGPDANQISSNVTINGQVFHTYGPPIGQQTPTVWVRVDGGFGFRYVWTGSPDAIPTGGTVTFTMTNPDGGSITWTKPLILNTETLQTQGTGLLGLDEPPPPASEVFSCWTDIPKGVYKNGQPEEAAWSLSNDPATAFAQGAHISFTITVNTPAGEFTVSAPNVASTLGVPAYWFTRLEDDSLLQAAHNQTNAPLGIIYGDPSVGLPPGNSSRLGY